MLLSKEIKKYCSRKEEIGRDNKVSDKINQIIINREITKSMK